MRLIEWSDRQGTKHLAWLRDGDLDEDAAKYGIPNDPPDLGPLGLPKKRTKELHNLLVERRLISYQNSIEFKRKLAEVAGGDVILGRQLLRLYRNVMQVQASTFVDDLGARIDALPYSERQRDCIKQTFAQAGIRCLADVENAPTRVGHVCGTDIYQLVALLLGKPR